MYSHLPPVWLIVALGVGIGWPVQIVGMAAMRRRQASAAALFLPLAGYIPLAIVSAVWVFVA